MRVAWLAVTGLKPGRNVADFSDQLNMQEKARVYPWLFLLPVLKMVPVSYDAP